MLKNFILWILGVLILIQLIQISLPHIPSKINKNSEITVSQDIASVLKTSCYDCHSYQTHIPWYGHIAPISWEVKTNIKKGRTLLNFQEFETYDKEKKEKIYKGITKSINFRMPLPMYLKIHEEARLTKEQRQTIKAWAKSHIRD